MGISYLGGNTWSELTREERYFTAMLFFELSKNLKPLLELFYSQRIDINPDDYIKYESAYEVCFYRDILKYYNLKNKMSFSPKRTFDLVLFSNDKIIIIEAKANQSFSSQQLNSFMKDREDLEKLFGNIMYDCPNILIIALISSKYKPSQNTGSFFDGCITWKQLSKCYQTLDGIFDRADVIYSDNAR